MNLRGDKAVCQGSGSGTGFLQNNSSKGKNHFYLGNFEWITCCKNCQAKDIE
jgi:hypothetical protein